MTKLWLKYLAWRKSRRELKIALWRTEQNHWMRKQYTFRSWIVQRQWDERSDDTVVRDQELINVFGCGWTVVRNGWIDRDRIEMSYAVKA